jgi:hypothetical protein
MRDLDRRLTRLEGGIALRGTDTPLTNQELARRIAFVIEDARHRGRAVPEPLTAFAVAPAAQAQVVIDGVTYVRLSTP